MHAQCIYTATMHIIKSFTGEPEDIFNYVKTSIELDIKQGCARTIDYALPRRCGKSTLLEYFKKNTNAVCVSGTQAGCAEQMPAQGTGPLIMEIEGTYFNEESLPMVGWKKWGYPVIVLYTPFSVAMLGDDMVYNAWWTEERIYKYNRRLREEAQVIHVPRSP